MNIMHGNLLDMAKDGIFDVVIHGANCLSVMGSGIAGEIATTHKNAAKVDKRNMIYSPSQTYHVLTRLGKITFANFKNEISDEEIHEYSIVNAYTQPTPGATLDYAALVSSLSSTINIFGNRNLRFGINQIGCGLGGGDWDLVYSIIDEIFINENMSVVIFDN